MEMLEVNERGEIIGLLTISDPKGDTQRWYKQNKRVVEHEHVSPARYYVNEYDDVVPRPAMGAFIVKIPGGFRLTRLPQPCKVTVNGTTWDVPDGTFEYATPLSGTHEVAVSAWPHLDWRTSVEVKRDAGGV